MSTNENLIKDILTKMFYDTRSTLNENEKRIIKEDGTCSEIRQQILINLDQDTLYVKGQIRSRKYPKWGKWGDGSCICGSYNPPEGYSTPCSFETGFSVKCCKNQKSPKLVVSTEKPSFEKYDPQKNQIDASGKFYDDTSFDGTPIKLPVDVKNVKRTNCGNQKFYYLDAPENAKKIKKIADVCSSYAKENKLQNKNFTDENDCLNKFAQKMVSFCTDDSVNSFEYNDLKYTICFSLGDNAEPKPEDMTVKGYYGADELTKSEYREKGECAGQKWNTTTGTSDQMGKNSQEFQTNQNTTGAEGGLGSEESTMSFIF